MWRNQHSLARALMYGARTHLRAESARGSASVITEGLMSIQPPGGSWLGHVLGRNHIWSKGFRSSSSILIERDVLTHDMTDGEESHLIWPPPDGFLDLMDPDMAKEILEAGDPVLESQTTKAVGGKKGTKAKSAKQRRQEDQIAADEPELHSEEDVDPAVDDMRYKKLVLKLRGFLNEKSKDVKDPNITKSVLKRLKIGQMQELLSNADLPTAGMKADLAARLWEHLRPIESLQRNKVRTMRKKYPGNYPMGLRHGSRGAELEGGMDPLDQLNKLSDEEAQQAEHERRRLAAVTSAASSSGAVSRDAAPNSPAPSAPAKGKGRGRPSSKATKASAEHKAAGVFQVATQVQGRTYPLAVSPEEVASLLQKAKITSVLILHLDKSLSHFTNAFVIGTGKSSRHLYAAANAVAYLVKQRFVEANYTEGQCSIQGQPDSSWVAVDAGSVVIHLFDQDTREHYNLEELWEPRAERAVWLADPDTVDTVQPLSHPNLH
eukprot:CAMPEP_0118959392 /NCGR_PEP_ID=MMETSP1169-20130426/63109_1 /TAXON_ID=36882 /ORGANISM="Pyramimonas obovata, Strain CCMP722" /LENGTH=491 /DNA_ID=CAMNT_0006907525 /DNA_START=316 /DNA_END=1791 /DNA_ORIENTATION=-